MRSPDGVFMPRVRARRISDLAFKAACAATALLAVAFLALLLGDIVKDGWHRLNWGFLSSFPSRKAEKAGILAALTGSLWLLVLTAALAIPLGIGAAIWLEEYSAKNRLTQVLEINIANLAGVPSIVYGILGLTLFVRGIGIGPSVLACSLTLALLVLPVVIIAAREALRAVPQSIRLAAFAVGATRWQAVRHHVVPAALPGILTGIILAVSRAIGESAPLIMMGALTYVAFVPRTPMDQFTVLPIQVFNWSSRPQPEFHQIAAAGILVLLAVLLSLNATAIFIRHRFQRFRR